MFYRPGNIGSFTSVPTMRTDSTFCAYVPASALVCGGDSIQYYSPHPMDRLRSRARQVPAGHHVFPICPNLLQSAISRTTPRSRSALPRKSACGECDRSEWQSARLRQDVGSGHFDRWKWCYTPVGSETVSVTVRCTDSCGLYWRRIIQCDFAVNDAPVCATVNDTTIFPMRANRSLHSGLGNGSQRESRWLRSAERTRDGVWRELVLHTVGRPGRQRDDPLHRRMRRLLR